MQSLRSLPLLRPSRSNSTDPSVGSRTASPAPPSTTPATANGLSTLNPAYGQDEKAATQLTERSISAGGHPRSKSLPRPLAGLAGLSLVPREATASPAPSQVQAINGSVPAPNGKSNTGVSPPGSRSITPLPVASAHPSEGATIDAIGLRLNEIVNRCLLGVDSKLLKGVRKGAGWGLGEAVVKELPSPSSDAYLLRAVLRTSVRSLSIYTSRLEYFLLPGITHADFPLPVNLNSTPITTPLLNQVQAYVLSICHAAWETCEVLEVALETTAYPRFVSETLRPVMDKLDSVVARVVMPLMASIKKQLVAALVGSDTPSPPTTHKSLPVGAVTTLPAKAINHIPTGLRGFASKVDPARKAFEMICKDCREDGETWVASVVVAVVWKGLCVCTAKYNPDEKAIPGHAGGRAPSPEAIGRALASLTKEGVSGAGGHKLAPSGGVTAVGKMASSILPSRAVSRPSSPPRSKGSDFGGGSGGPGGVGAGVAAIPPSAVALASLEALVARLVIGLVQKPAPIAPAADDPTASEHLAREALAEALEAITSMRTVIAAMERGATYMCDVNKHLKDDLEMPDAKDELVVDAVEDVPAVLLFHLLGKRINTALSSSSTSVMTSATTGAAIAPTRGRSTGQPIEPKLLRSPAAVWGISEEEYERQILSAFSVAEERARRVALAYKSDLERLNRELLINGPAAGDESNGEAKLWIKALALAVQARTGVAVVVTGA